MRLAFLLLLIVLQAQHSLPLYAKEPETLNNPEYGKQMSCRELLWNSVQFPTFRRAYSAIRKIPPILVVGIPVAFFVYQREKVRTNDLHNFNVNFSSPTNADLRTVLTLWNRPIYTPSGTTDFEKIAIGDYVFATPFERDWNLLGRVTGKAESSKNVGGQITVEFRRLPQKIPGSTDLRLYGRVFLQRKQWVNLSTLHVGEIITAYIGTSAYEVKAIIAKIYDGSQGEIPGVEISVIK